MHGRCSRPTRCASWWRRSPIRRSAPSPASCCSMRIALPPKRSRPPARRAPRRRARRAVTTAARTSARLHAALDDRRRRRPLLEVREAAAPARERASARRSARPAPSTRCAASLLRPLPADTILDDVLTPMRVVLAGYRVVFNEQARAFDRAAATPTPRRGARSGRSPATSRFSRSSRAAAAVAQPGVAAVRVAQARAAARALRAAGDLRRQHRAALPATALLRRASLAGQVLFFLLAGSGAILDSCAGAARRAAPVGAVAGRAPHAAREIA